MRMTEQAYSWEVKGLERRLTAVEERLNRRDRERFRNALLLLWLLGGTAVAGLVVLAALS
jgi:hypothetical protein